MFKRKSSIHLFNDFCHPRVGGDPVVTLFPEVQYSRIKRINWTPVYAGVTPQGGAFKMLTQKIFPILVYIVILLFSQLALAEENIANNFPEEVALNQDGELIEENFEHNKKIAVVQVLNKITAKSKNLEIPVDSQVNFGTIRIAVKTCWKSSPYELAENKILLNIAENNKEQKEYITIFDGWMFSSSPAISSMEHSVYDVVAINCHD